MEIRILGSVEIVTDDGASIPLSRTAERCVLGAFALSPGRRLSVDDLVSRVWGDDPPDRADETLGTYVRSVRRALARAGAPPGALRSHRPRMYSLNLDPAIIDYHAFGTLCVAAREAAALDDPAASELYRSALDTWRGPAFCGIHTEWAERYRYSLDQERIEAVYALCEQLSNNGEHLAAAARIESLARESVPTDRMMLIGIDALRLAGRRAAIPSFVDRLARHMIEEAGARPSAAVYAAARGAVSDDHQEPGVATLQSGSLTTAEHGISPARRRVDLSVVNSRRTYQAGGGIVIFKGNRG